MTRDECRAKCIETVAKTLYESDRDGPCSLALRKLCLSIGEMASGPRPLQRVSAERLPPCRDSFAALHHRISENYCG
jgi:hypothetical protein